MNTSAATKAKPREWMLDVCRTCGRKAEWPFCEHREEALALAEDGRGVARWYETVRVREVGHRVR